MTNCRRHRRRRGQDAGFTLVETLVTLLIALILLGVVLASTGQLAGGSEDKRDLATARAVLEVWARDTPVIGARAGLDPASAGVLTYRSDPAATRSDLESDLPDGVSLAPVNPDGQRMQADTASAPVYIARVALPGGRVLCVNLPAGSSEGAGRMTLADRPDQLYQTATNRAGGGSAKLYYFPGECMSG